MVYKKTRKRNTRKRNTRKRINKKKLQFGGNRRPVIENIDQNNIDYFKNLLENEDKEHKEILSEYYSINQYEGIKLTAILYSAFIHKYDILDLFLDHANIEHINLFELENGIGLYDLLIHNYLSEQITDEKKQMIEKIFLKIFLKKNMISEDYNFNHLHV